MKVISLFSLVVAACVVASGASANNPSITQSFGLLKGILKSNQYTNCSNGNKVWMIDQASVPGEKYVHVILRGPSGDLGGFLIGQDGVTDAKVTVNGASFSIATRTWMQGDQDSHEKGYYNNQQLAYHADTRTLFLRNAQDNGQKTQMGSIVSCTIQ